MKWNKKIVLENMEKLNQTDYDIFAYATDISIDFFIDLWGERDNDAISFANKMDELQKNFESYPTGHPFRSLWNRIIVGAKKGTLIPFTYYGDEYKDCAMRINNVWNMENYHWAICIILKAFAERDWDELEEKFDGVYDTYEEAQADIEHSCYTIVENLDTEDLKTIIKFCGGE